MIDLTVTPQVIVDLCLLFACVRVPEYTTKVLHNVQVTTNRRQRGLNDLVVRYDSYDSRVTYGRWKASCYALNNVATKLIITLEFGSKPTCVIL